MRYLLAYAAMAAPAFAHHEAALASALPSVLPWIIAASAGGLTLWRNLRKRRSK